MANGLGACLLANSPPDLGETMLNMRIQGKSWKEIGDELGTSAQSARAAFRKLTGINDLKLKGKELESIANKIKAGFLDDPAVKKAMTKAVKEVDDALVKASTKEWNKKMSEVWDQTQDDLADLKLSNPSVGKLEIWDSYQSGTKSYLKLSQQYGVSIKEVDEVIWRRLLLEADGDVWDAYKLKPTSELGFKAVQEAVFDLRKKGWSFLEIEDFTGIPKNVSKLITEGKWQLPSPGSTQVFGANAPPPPPPSGVLFDITGPSSGEYPYVSPREMDEWIASFGKDLTDAQVQAIKAYTDGAYSDLNRWLRGTEPNTYYQHLVEELDSVMRPLPKSMTLERHVGYDAFQGKDNIYGLGGKTIEDKGYMSTSVAEGGVFKSKPVRMVIEVPAGTKGRWVSNISSVGSGEQEVLLARNTEMFIQKVVAHPDGSNFTIYAKVVAQ